DHLFPQSVLRKESLGHIMVRLPPFRAVDLCQADYHPAGDATAVPTTNNQVICVADLGDLSWELSPGNVEVGAAWLRDLDASRRRVPGADLRRRWLPVLLVANQHQRQNEDSGRPSSDVRAASLHTDLASRGAERPSSPAGETHEAAWP